MINVAIWTLTAGAPKATYTTSLMGMTLYFLNNAQEANAAMSRGAALDAEDRGFTYDLFIGSNIIAGREHAVEEVLDSDNATHILMIDDDMGWKSPCLNIALDWHKPIVIANYRRKTPPWTFTARHLDGSECKTEVGKDGLEEVGYGGFGFALIHRDVLRDTKPPRFLPHYVRKPGAVRGEYTTEDYPFFAQARAAGYPVYVDHTISKQMWHLGDFVYQWNQVPRDARATERSYDAYPDEPMRA